MTFDQSDLDRLKKALTSGVTSVSTNGRTVQFASIDELKTLIAEIEANIRANTPNTPYVNPNRVTATFRKCR